MRYKGARILTPLWLVPRVRSYIPFGTIPTVHCLCVDGRIWDTTDVKHYSYDAILLSIFRGETQYNHPQALVNAINVLDTILCVVARHAGGGPRRIRAPARACSSRELHHRRYSSMPPMVVPTLGKLGDCYGYYYCSSINQCIYSPGCSSSADTAHLWRVWCSAKLDALVFCAVSFVRLVDPGSGMLREERG